MNNRPIKNTAQIIPPLRTIHVASDHEGAKFVNTIKIVAITRINPIKISNHLFIFILIIYSLKSYLLWEGYVHLVIYNRP